MKKLLSVFVAAITLLTLVACGNSGQPEPEDVSQPPAQEPENAPAAQPEAPQAPEVSPEPEDGGVLVVYYSATGSTEAVAGYIADALDGDTFAIVPADPYTSDDLNWRNSESRVSREHDDPSLRTMELAETTVDGWDSYDTVFIGYPIWWGIAAWPVDNFITANDFTGKTVIPFCTSSSSGLGQSGELLAELAGAGNWLEGQRFRSGASQSDVQAWVRGLNLPAAPAAPSQPEQQ